MLHSQFLQPTWPDHNSLLSSYQNEVDPHGFDMAAHLGDFEFPSSLTTIDDCYDISMSIPHFSNMYLEGLLSENIPLATFLDDTHAISPLQEYPWSLDELGSMSKGELLANDIEYVCGWEGENQEAIPLQSHSLNEEESTISSSHSFNEEKSTISSTNSCDVSFGETVLQPSTMATGEGIGFDNETSILHLLKAYGEAVGMGSIGLAEVILQRIRDKVSPVGLTMERLAHYLFQGIDEKTDYLELESSKNYDDALRAFYETYPSGRFAHFAANMAILEAIPEEVQTVHILDFDIGEGVQWPPLLVALGQHRRVRLTSVTQREQAIKNPQLKFKATKKRLCNYAKSQGLLLEVEEMDMEDLVEEKTRMKKRGGGKEWMAFNCMLGLPHMSREKSRKNACEFIKMAKEIMDISNSGSSNTSNRYRGIITSGSGDGAEIRKGDCGDFGSFFSECLLHFHALFESLESHFPPHLSLARTAMECLFVGPCVSFADCYGKWEEWQKACEMQLDEGLGGWRMSQENLLEAKELVRQGESLYEVKVAGERENEMILEWRGTPLVRVSVLR